jgi:hypothetical protein
VEPAPRGFAVSEEVRHGWSPLSGHGWLKDCAVARGLHKQSEEDCPYKGQSSQRMMVVFHTFLISSKSSSLTLRAVHARMIALNSSVLTSSEISPVLRSILTSMVFSFFRNQQWSSPPGFSWALCAAALSGESPGQLVASPVSKGGFRVLLYGVRLVSAVFVLALYAAKPNPEGAGVKAGTRRSRGAQRAVTQERPEDYLASSPERKNSRDEPESRTPPLETSPRGRNERGWPGDSKRSTEGSMKDQTTSIGAQRREGGWGA